MSFLLGRQDPNRILEPHEWQSWGPNTTPHPLFGSEEELRTSSWEDVSKLALTSPARAMNPDVQTEVRAAIPLVRAEMKKSPGITSIMCFVGRSLKASLHQFSHPAKGSIYFL